MSKWYVEYKSTDKSSKNNFGMGCMGKIEAKDGKEAIEYVKRHVFGAYKFKVWHDDEEETV